MQITLSQFHSVTYASSINVGWLCPAHCFHVANKAVENTHWEKKHLLFICLANPSDVYILYWWQPDLNPSPSNGKPTRYQHIKSVWTLNCTIKFDNLKLLNLTLQSHAVHETVLPEYSALITNIIGWKIQKLQGFWTLVTLLWVTNFQNWVKKSWKSGKRRS